MKNSLRVRRAERRLSQMDTARQAGIPEGRYWRIENGYTDPTDDERRALASVFAVSDRVLFPGAPKLGKVSPAPVTEGDEVSA